MRDWDYTHDYKCHDDFFVHECEECGADFRSPHKWATICKSCWKASRGISNEKPATKQTPFIPDEMLKRLIQLCHPDRHNGSIASHKALQWLLDQRKR